MLVTELCREHGMSNASFYKWLSKYGGYYSIHAAASFGHADIVNLFLPNNLDVNIISEPPRGKPHGIKSASRVQTMFAMCNHGLLHPRGKPRGFAFA